MSVADDIKEVERKVDGFFSYLEIRHYPRNLAQWAILTRSALEVQRIAAVEYGGPKHRAATINYSRIAALVLNEIASKGNQRYASQRSLEWREHLGAVTFNALKEAEGYFSAWACFPDWHQGRFKAELSGNRITFTSEELPRQRQIRAFQKGILPKAARESPARSLAPVTQRVANLFEDAVSSCGGRKSLRLVYTTPADLYAELLPWFKAQSEKLVRRRDEVDLGMYTIKDIKAFLAALQTICAVHDHLCFLVGSRHAFPINSAVLSKTRPEWISDLSMLSGLGHNVLNAIIEDLTFGRRAPIDLHSELFIPLDQQGNIIGLLPQFGLSARVDENMLRTLARSDEKRYSKVSETKEQEMVDDLRGSSSNVLSIKGPFQLPKEAHTDLDLVVVDENSSTVVIAELKWIRKPLFVKERARADEEFVKGLDQLRTLRSFLKGHPSYLRTRAALAKDLSEYANVYFALVGRDHLNWGEPDAGCFIIEYETFKEKLRATGDLHHTAVELLGYSWLPVEGVDFEIKMDPSTAGETVIVGPSYHTL